MPIKEETVRELIDFLQNCSRQTVRRNYRVKSVDVTMQIGAGGAADYCYVDAACAG